MESIDINVCVLVYFSVHGELSPIHYFIISVAYNCFPYRPCPAHSNVTHAVTTLPLMFLADDERLTTTQSWHSSNILYEHILISIIKRQVTCLFMFNNHIF